MTSGVRTTRFGVTPDGREVTAVELLAADGVGVVVLTLGATVQSITLPGSGSSPIEITAGYDTLSGYLGDPYYMGATIGRYANRIAGGAFSLDRRDYRIVPNSGLNALHGGQNGFDRALWSIAAIENGGAPAVALQHVSHDGDQGFPGRLAVTATFRLLPEYGLTIEYNAETDRPTIVNLTSHIYWNLAGYRGHVSSPMDHRLTMAADAFLPTDATGIPTGEVRPVVGGPFDFRVSAPIGAGVRNVADEEIRLARGYDHTMVLAPNPNRAIRFAARLEDPDSGRAMEVFTDQPGLQFYSANFFDGTVAGRGGLAHRQGDAIALEPQLFPDTPNRPEFGSARIDPGQIYANRMRFRFFS